MFSPRSPSNNTRVLTLSAQAFQRQVHERLTQLELVNKQYRRLARENRTDAASKLKVMVHEGNQRWDGLQRRVASVLRRLKVRGCDWSTVPPKQSCDRKRQRASNLPDLKRSLCSPL